MPEVNVCTGNAHTTHALVSTLWGSPAFASGLRLLEATTRRHVRRTLAFNCAAAGHCPFLTQLSCVLPPVHDPCFPCGGPQGRKRMCCRDSWLCSLRRNGPHRPNPLGRTCVGVASRLGRERRAPQQMRCARLQIAELCVPASVALAPVNQILRRRGGWRDSR